jgi:hypothetical protein
VEKIKDTEKICLGYFEYTVTIFMKLCQGKNGNGASSGQA